MRAKEWYSWHFPELARIITDNHVYTKIVDLVGVKDCEKIIILIGSKLDN